MSNLAIRVEFPEKAKCLLSPAPYKVLYGGRGSAKSWSAARALLLLGVQRPMRILCAREVQKSVRESVFSLLKDQIRAMGLSGFYSDILEREIRGMNGTKIVFSGLANHTVDSLKSFEGVDVCWIEEAQVVSKYSLDLLDPTIRKAGAEIWATFNPLLESDEIYRRFVANTPPPGSVVQEMNWRDNPWWNAVLEAKRIHYQATESEDDYLNIWEGRPRAAVQGAIYAREMAQMVADGRIGHMPWDPDLPVHVVWDLGWNDLMAVGLVQRLRSELRVIEYLEGSAKTIEEWIGELRAKPYRYGTFLVPHDAKNKDIKSGRSVEEIVADYGFEVRVGPREPVETGIRTTRSVFPRLYLDRTRCADLIEHLKRYRRRIDSVTQTPREPVHDEHSNAADMLRYLAMGAEQLTNEASGSILDRPWRSNTRRVGAYS